MRIKYEIDYPNQFQKTIVGSISLNGKLLFWASLTAFPRTPSKQNAWKRAKMLCNQALSGRLNNANATRLFTFITFNKVYKMQGLCYYQFNSYNNVYICYDQNNTCHCFAVYINRHRKNKCLNFIKNAPGPVGNLNYFYAANYTPSLQTVYIEDPPHDNTRIIDISQMISSYKQQLIEDFYKLQYEEREINGEKYLISDLGDGYKIGISNTFITESNSWFDVRQQEHSDPIMKNIYLEIDRYDKNKP